MTRGSRSCTPTPRGAGSNLTGDRESDPLEVFRQLQDAYRGYVDTCQTIRNGRIRGWLSERIEEGRFLWRVPYVTLSRRFQPGEALADLVAEDLLHASIPRIFRKRRDDLVSPPT